ncbi:MAG: glycosyltransferase [Anaerolineales bacterium]
MASETQTIDLSVVVAAEDAGSSLRKCLASLTAQLTTLTAEIIVADGTAGEAARRLEQDFPSVRFLPLPTKIDVPRLWSAGIAVARGRIVAITIGHCVPAPNWAQQVLHAHAADWPAIGGAIDLDPNAGLVDRAIYFCRYSRYMPPFAPEYLDDLPGDNCSYKRAALEGLQEHMTDGFLETFVHQAMRKRGDRLLCDPSILVYYNGSPSWVAFAKRRLVHGCYFAARRAREMDRFHRVLRVGASFAVPLVLFQRIASRVWKRRRHRVRFLVCLPLLVPFLVAWATGEFLGYLAGPSRAPVGEGNQGVWDEVL